MCPTQAKHQTHRNATKSPRGNDTQSKWRSHTHTHTHTHEFHCYSTQQTCLRHSSSHSAKTLLRKIALHRKVEIVSLGVPHWVNSMDGVEGNPSYSTQQTCLRHSSSHLAKTFSRKMSRHHKVEIVTLGVSTCNSMKKMLKYTQQ